MKCFEAIALWQDEAPREGALQMAVDEALLEALTHPVLRVYQWAGPCVSIGYFESRASAQKRHPGLPIFRRWTGGGLVLHGKDAPYSLLVPQGGAFAKVRPADSYRILHGLLAEALRPRFPHLTLVEACPATGSRNCFENPVAGDLLLEGRKVAGAGQRRSRQGLLHQGSLHGVGAFVEAKSFAHLLADRVFVLEPETRVLQRACALHATRYGTESWNVDRTRPAPTHAPNAP